MLADVIDFLLALAEVVYGVAEVQEMLREQRGQGIAIRPIVAIGDLQFELVADASALEASIGLFFGHYFGENFEHPAVHNVEGLLGECDEEAAFGAGSDEGDDRLRKQAGRAGIETSAIIFRPYSQSIVVMQSHQLPRLLHLLDLPHQNRSDRHQTVRLRIQRRTHLKHGLRLPPGHDLAVLADGVSEVAERVTIDLFGLVVDERVDTDLHV